GGSSSRRKLPSEPFCPGPTQVPRRDIPLRQHTTAWQVLVLRRTGQVNQYVALVSTIKAQLLSWTSSGCPLFSEPTLHRMADSPWSSNSRVRGQADLCTLPCAGRRL